MTKRILSLGLVTLVGAAVLVPTSASHAGDLGHWSETGGLSTIESPTTPGEASPASMTPAATVNHRGASETKVISGTSNKRAHGWTTWSGVYHYTTAQLERGNGAVITSSGRKWGTSGTEAVSAYKAFNPGAADNGWGHAKTYYGK